MSTKTLACIVLGLTLALIVLLLPGRVDGDGRAAQAGVRAARADRAAVAVEAPDPASTGGSALPGPFGVDRTPIAAPGGEAADSVRRQGVVLVLHDERPVADARVLFLAAKETDAFVDRVFWYLEGIDAFLEEHGNEVFTDEQGLASVPDAGEDVLLVAAYAQGLFGRDWFASDGEQPWRIELEQDATFLVRVVDGQGAAVAGIGVCVRSFSYGLPTAILRATTDREGLGRLAHAAEWLGQADAVLAIDAPLDPPVEHPLPSEAFSQEIARLTLPPSASLSVEVVESDGSPFAGRGALNVSVVPPGHSSKTRRWGNDRCRTRYELGPTVRIAYAQCGAELALSAVREGSSRDSEVLVSAPARPGGTGRARLVLGAGHPVCAWRLVDEAAAPLAERSIRVQVTRVVAAAPDEPPATGTGREVRLTDGDGRLVLDLPPWQEGETRTVLFLDEESDPTRCASVRLDAPLSAGRRECGDVVLDVAPLFVTGRVVGPLGEPVPGAWLQVERLHEWGWRQDWTLRERADDQGAFVWRAPVAAGPWRLLARSREASSAPVPFEAGERDLVLRVEKSGSVAGRYLLGEPLDERHSLFIQLEQAEESEEHPSPTRGWKPVDAQGAFQFFGVRPGRYRVVLRGSDWGEVLHRGPEVLVHGGQTTELPAIDLRSVVRRFRIELVPPGPDPALSAELELCSPDGESLCNTSWEGRSAEVFTLQESVRARISARGYRDEVVEPLLPENRVELRRAPRVRVRLTGDAALPAAPHQLGLVLAPPGEQVRDWTFMPFDEDREVIVDSAEVGPLRVVWVLQHENLEGGFSISSADSDPLQLVTVADVPGEQTVVVRLERRELEALLGRGR